MTLPSELRKMNKRLGRELGTNPHGDPLYKWIWVNDWMHLMRDIKGFAPKALPSGLIVMEPDYIQRRMVPGLDAPDSPYRDRWHVGHWHDCGDQRIWEETFGTQALWSRFGYYSMTDVWGPPAGTLPTDSVTDGLIIRVKQFRSMSRAEIRDKFAADAEREEKRNDATRMDMIGDALTAFGNIPGTRGGHVSFPSTTKELNPPAVAGA